MTVTISNLDAIGGLSRDRDTEILDGLAVTLVRPPMLEARGNPAIVMCPPLGIAYLGATLREYGASVTMVDAVGEAPRQATPLDETGFLAYGLPTAEVVARVPRHSAVIGVSCMFSEEWRAGREVIRALGKAYPDALLVAGGEHVSAVPEFVLEQCPDLDYCVLGEGEETLLSLCTAVKRGIPIDANLPGIVGRADGGIFRSPSRSRIRDLESIAPPAWDLIPMENYFDRALPFGVNRGRCIPILASRGCPYRCTFCSSPDMWTTLWRARDPDAVLDEMGAGIERYGARNFDFFDLTAIVRKPWIREFCEKLIERQYNITWQIPQGTRSEAIDGEISQLLFASGCRNISYAPESGSPSLLRRIKKKVNLDTMTESMAAALDAGLKVKCNFIVGLPDESRDEFHETLSFVRKLARLGVHDVNASPYCPYPGSALFERLVGEGKIALGDQYFDMLADSDDVGFAESHCNGVSRSELGYWRWRVIAEFYVRNFAHHPGRVVSMIRNLREGKQTTRLERTFASLLGH